MQRMTSWSIGLASLCGVAWAQTPLREIAERTAPLYERRVSTGFVREDADLLRVELRGRAPSAGHASLELQLTLAPVDGSAEGPAHPLWTGGVVAPAWRGALSHARAGGGVQVAGTADGGATRRIALWSLPSGRGPAAEANFDALQELRCAVPGTAEEPRTLRARDLYDPVLVELGHELHVVACARGAVAEEGPAEEYVWTARLDLPAGADAEAALWQRGVDGRFLAPGVDPRVLRQGAELLVAVRAPATTAERMGAAPLRFYRSADLVSFSLDEPLSSGVRARGDYAVASDGGSIWLATSTDEDGASLTVRRFDPADGSWRDVSQRALSPVSPATGAARCWLVPRAASSGLELLYLGAGDDLVRQAL